MLISEKDFENAAVNVIRNNKLPCNFEVADGCSGCENVIAVSGKRADWLHEQYPECVIFGSSLGEVYVFFDAYYSLARQDVLKHEFPEGTMEDDPARVDDYLYWQWFVFIRYVDLTTITDYGRSGFGLCSYERAIMAALDDKQIAADKRIGFQELYTIEKAIDRISEKEGFYLSQLPFETRVELCAIAVTCTHSRQLKRELTIIIRDALTDADFDLDEDEIDSFAWTEADYLCWCVDDLD